MIPPVRLSFTRAKALSCPYMYRQLYILGVTEPKADFTMRGTMLHAIAAEYIKRLSRMGLPRASKLFWRIFDDHTKYVNPQARAEMAGIAANWVNWFKLPQYVERVLTEHEMAVARDGTPLSMADAINPDGTAKLDCFTGIADCLIEAPRGAMLYDWKMGNQRFDMFEGQDDVQLSGYAWLWMLHNPECDSVTATLYAPKFNSITTAEFTRETLLPRFDEHLAGLYERADAIRTAGLWEAAVHYRDACGFCRLDCPKDDEFYPRSAA